MAVRLEKVVLSLDDGGFSTQMARNAAATGLLERALKSLDGTNVHLDRVTDSTAQTTKAMSDGGREIDRYSGRLSLLADAAAILGPSLVPIGAVAVPAVTALASQFGAAAIAGGTMVVAFQGVGDTLEAVNKAALEPTTDNLAAAELAMARLGPQARSFVQELSAMRPQFLALRDSAAAGLFPGLEASLSRLIDITPRLQGILQAVGDAAGDLADDFADGLAGPRGREFLAFIQTEMPSALAELGQTVGNFAAGLGELWMAFTPLNRDVTGWLLQASSAFDQWASSLAQSDGFADFVQYLRTSGPQVADALGAIGNAVLQIVKAAAPLGGPTLAAIEAFADVVAAVANSGAGPALIALASGLALVSRALKGFEAVKKSALFADLIGGVDGATSSMSRMQRVAVGAAGALAAFAVIDSLQGGLKDFSIGLDEMTESILSVNDAAASGSTAAIDNLDGLAASIDRLANPGRAEALQDTISNALGGLGNEEEYDKAVAQIEALDAALTNLVATGNQDQASAFLNNLGLTESQMADLLSLMPQYEDALSGVKTQSLLAGEAAARGAGRAAAGFREAKSAAQEFADAVQRANRILEGRSAAVNYEQAIDDMTKSIKENGRTLDINTQKGRNNRQALDNMAASAVEMSQQLKIGNRLPFLEKARGDISDAAQRLGLTRSQANELADKLLQLDKIRANPKVTVETARAQGNVQNLLNAMAQIRDRTVTVTTVFTESGKHFKDFDTGGYTGDVNPRVATGVVHGNEVVIPAPLVKRDASYLRSRYGHLPGMDQLPGYASGGFVASATAAYSRPIHATSQPFQALPAVAAVDLGIVVQELGALRSEVQQFRNQSAEGPERTGAAVVRGLDKVGGKAARSR